MGGYCIGRTMREKHPGGRVMIIVDCSGVVDNEIIFSRCIMTFRGHADVCRSFSRNGVVQ